MSNPWLDDKIFAMQRMLADAQLQEKQPPPHFAALAGAVRATQCPGEILLVGCGTGHEREVLDRSGASYTAFCGVDINPEAIRLAKERYPESTWICDAFTGAPRADVVIDSACVMHIEDWRAQLANLCRSSRRWLILHRVPLGAETMRGETTGYEHKFPAWLLSLDDIRKEMDKHGYLLGGMGQIDESEAHTVIFAKKRHYATYADSAYLTRLKALHASMLRHCAPFELHVLAWDEGVMDWCYEAPNVSHSHVDDFLRDYPNLRPDALPGPHRTRVEHMQTIGPSWIREVMEETGEPVTYLDADLFAFGSPEPFFAEVGGAQAEFVGHNFAETRQGLPGPTVESHQGAFGKLNVGACHFNDIKVADRWATLCRNWCYDQVDIIGGRYADQKYLERLCDEYVVTVSKNPAAMVGPWNIHTRALWVNGGVPYFGGKPVGFYHYSSLVLGPHGQDQLTRPEYRLTDRQAQILYAPYLAALEEAKR